MTGNPPVDVQEFGQSIWYDNISRALLQNGEIERLVQEDGVLGITSNPTIFENAISGSSIYDKEIASHLEADVNTIFEAIAIEDIRAGADILRPVYERTNGGDGYISLEVSPLIADDMQTTLNEARRLFKLVDRPNLMIKIPATPAGLPAIEEAIFEGININITLIFSVDNYREVVEAYLRGLERRHAAGQDIQHVASVASFFLSRIDTLIDQQLESNLRAAQGRDLDRVSANRRLLGKAAIANAKAAYRHFKKVFNSERFVTLRNAGARVQRPLWASTGTKNPNYPDTIYVDSLIGPQTVNTVPPQTLAAFKDHGKVAATLEENMQEADTVFDMLAEVGIDIGKVTHTLQVDGVERFATSFRHLMEAIEGKRRMLAAGIVQRQSMVIGAYETGVREEIEAMKDAPQRIWNRDAAWWKSEPHHQTSIKNRLGWLDLFRPERIDRERLVRLQETARTAGWQHIVLLGMGGSSLAPEVLRKTYGIMGGYPELLVLDSTAPASIYSIEKTVDLRKTVFVVASKSGTTVETASFFDYFYAKVSEVVGAENAGKHFIAITDPGTKLVAESKERKLFEIFENPADVGGRYSALSYFGLVPAALMGLDLPRLFASADQMLMAIDPSVPASGNPGIWLGALVGYLGQHGRNKMTLLTSPAIESFGNWVEQLVAESTGKEGKGIVPVVGATFGMPHDYDDDRLFIYLRLDGEATELDQRVRTLWEAGHPVVTLNLPDSYALGGEFLRWELATAVMGQVLSVNPFDEPDVTSAKKATETFLETYLAKGALPSEKPIVSEDNVSLYVGSRVGEILTKVCQQRNYDGSQLAGLLAAHLSQARSGDYIALLAYMEMIPEHEAALQDIRRRLRHATQRAVTIGYGPRYLHSTGQLHKGGPDIGVFILITVDDEHELPIPGRPYSFSILKQAQGLGDLQTLRDRRRRVVHLHITGNIQSGLQKIIEAIQAAEAKRL